MKTKYRSIRKTLFMLVTILALMLPQTVFAADGTDGRELRVGEPEKLEIQLGTAWTGVEFQLKTDAGLYPGVIPVGEDGVLRLEIGGSKNYVLTCKGSNVAVPIQVPAPAADESEPTTESDTTEPVTEKEEIAGIPVMHLILFGGGMAIAVGGLIAMYVVKRRKASLPQAEDYDEDEEN